MILDVKPRGGDGASAPIRPETIAHQCLRQLIADLGEREVLDRLLLCGRFQWVADAIGKGGMPGVVPSTDRPSPPARPGMESAIRYCQRCRASTDHRRDRDGDSSVTHPGLRIVRWLAMALLSPWLNPWRCDLCEMRDARG